MIWFGLLLFERRRVSLVCGFSGFYCFTSCCGLLVVVLLVFVVGLLGGVWFVGLD